MTSTSDVSSTGPTDPTEPPVPRPLPRLEGLTGEFYGWPAQGELRFQRCADCRAWRHLPRPRCPHCHSPAWSWERSSGRGRVFSWTVTHRALHPYFTELPYAQVLVEMDEGPRVLSWVVDVEADDLTFDLPVEVRFLTVDGATLPVFVRGEG
ncbi:MAG TPA: OB-fold domain-containing protein [Acidimicrobiales bacterium]